VNEVGKFLVIAGLTITLIGFVLWSGIGRNWIGKLPGDIHYSTKNVSFHFPIVTCIVISVVLTILSWIFRR
jgi:hypothetical protein